MEHLIDIPGRLHSVAVEKHIAGTDQIYDDLLKTTLDILNLENITDVKVQEGKLLFLNIQGLVLKEISITTEQKQSDWNLTDSTQVDFIKNKPTVYNKLEVDDKLTTKQDTIDDLTIIRSGALAGATAYQKPQTGIPATDLASDIQSDLATIDSIEAVIPEQASPSNQLADKNFVNSSVATNTANYISDNGQPFQSLEHLEAYEGVLTNNDYAFVVGADSAGNTTYSRYKYNVSTHQWALEYILNNSSFTAEQWESISSGITNSLVAKLSVLPTNNELTTILNGKVDTDDLNKYVPKTDSDDHGNQSIYSPGNLVMTLADEQGVLNQTGTFSAGGWSVSSPDGRFQTFGNSIYRGTMGLDHDSVVWEKTATQKIPAATTEANGLMSAEDKQKITDIEAVIPEQASSSNKLVDIDFMNSSIATATATYRGAFNLVTNLHLSVSATHVQIATALATAVQTADNNDYCYVQIPVADATSTEFASVERYKFNGTAWEYEYTLNNSGFTAAQWAALNSGITSGLVAKLSALPTNSELTALLNDKATNSDLAEVTVGVAIKQDKMPITQVASGTTAINAAVNTYYEVAGEVGALAISLPTPTDLTKVAMVVIHLTAGTNPKVVIGAVDNPQPDYSAAYDISAGNEYEINCLYNGDKWVVADMEVL